LALSNSSCNETERDLLQSRGWRVRDALGFTHDLDQYRSYIARSRGEFTVAKDQNVRLRSGWFSDRSATYLASGRPVITQETGFSNVLPVGEGLFAFSSLEEIIGSVECIQSDYSRHRRVAFDIARTYFSHEVVLSRLLADLGISRVRGKSRQESVLPPELMIIPTSRWPTRLPAATLDIALKLAAPVAEAGSQSSRRRVSVIVVTHNGLAYTKMCLKSLFGAGWRANDEIIIIDNGSTDGTQQFLRELSSLNSAVRVEMNDHNRGFAAANNQGAFLARGDILVFLNNDTITPRGWMEGLVRWLEDPETGMVGPVTNRTCNEAQIDAPYRTFGEFEVFAGEYTRQHAGQAAEIAMLAMFCVAMRREVFESVGPLDEQFQIGMFEDDDYAQRVRKTGYKIVCAEDVFVHHFGQASLGELCIEGKYDHILESNRRRFEAKWGIQWQPHRRRTTPDYENLRSAIRQLAAQRLPSGATVLVITKGDEELLKFTEHCGWHFPRDNEGRYTNIYPADSAEAITQLESSRANGAGFLLIPRPALWWLDFYAGFKDHLERNYVLTVREEETCLIFDVREPAEVKEQYAASSHH
jgi:GT2 family glycosyltransferase